MRDDIAPHICKNLEIHYLEILKCTLHPMRFKIVMVCEF